MGPQIGLIQSYLINQRAIKGPANRPYTIGFNRSQGPYYRINTKEVGLFKVCCVDCVLEIIRLRHLIKKSRRWAEKFGGC